MTHDCQRCQAQSVTAQETADDEVTHAAVELEHWAEPTRGETRAWAPLVNLQGQLGTLA